MREEIWRARHSLLTGQDSQGVKSVIRLLEQTYDRLQHDDNNEATLLMSTSTLPLNDDVLEVSLMIQKTTFSACLPFDMTKVTSCNLLTNQTKLSDVMYGADDPKVTSSSPPSFVHSSLQFVQLCNLKNSS